MQKRPFIIAFSGGSGSGKTYLSQAVVASLRESASLFSYDAYYKDTPGLGLEERKRLNYDDPRMLDAALFLSHLEALERGESIALPQYDCPHYRRKEQTIPFHPQDIVIIDGIMTLQDARFLPHYQLAIYVDADADVRLSRRIRRDMAERGRTLDSILDQYMSQVKPMHERYIEPSKSKADLVFSNNRLAGLDQKEFAALVEEIEARYASFRRSQQRNGK